MRTILISESDFYDFDICSCITYDMSLYNILHDAEVKVGETLRLFVEDRDLYCDVYIREIEYGDGTIWTDYLGDNKPN